MESRMAPKGVRGGLGSQFLFNAYKYLLEGGTVPEHFAERRTVFVPETQIFASLTREAEVSTLPWTQTEKYIALAGCRSGQRAWHIKRPVLTLSAVTDEEGYPLGR